MTKAPRANEYTPYDQLPAFNKGYNDYCKANYTNPFGDVSTDAQAWDRGHEYAMRLNQWVYLNKDSLSVAEICAEIVTVTKKWNVS